MNGIIERVARRVARNHYPHGVRDGHGLPLTLEEYMDISWRLYRGEARDYIEAMIDPTDGPIPREVPLDAPETEIDRRCRRWATEWARGLLGGKEPTAAVVEQMTREMWMIVAQAKREMWMIVAQAEEEAIKAYFKAALE